VDIAESNLFKLLPALRALHEVKSTLSLPLFSHQRCLSLLGRFSPSFDFLAGEIFFFTSTGLYGHNASLFGGLFRKHFTEAFMRYFLLRTLHTEILAFMKSRNCTCARGVRQGCRPKIPAARPFYRFTGGSPASTECCRPHLPSSGSRSHRRGRCCRVEPWLSRRSRHSGGCQHPTTRIGRSGSHRAGSAVRPHAGMRRSHRSGRRSDQPSPHPVPERSPRPELCHWPSPRSTKNGTCRGRGSCPG